MFISSTTNSLQLNPARTKAAALATGIAALLVSANAFSQGLIPGDLLISGSVYDAPSSAVVVGQTLPGGGTAVQSGAYPYVFNNATPDPSFGIASPIFIQQVNPANANSIDQTINIPTSVSVTSFSSKSELGLNITPDGQHVVFSGYGAPDSTLDVSNSNTPNPFDATNPVSSVYTRSIVQLNANLSTSVVYDDGYSGNNQRAALLDQKTGNYITVGNAGNGSATAAGLDALSADTGVQLLTPTATTTTLNGVTGANTQVVGVFQNSTSGNTNGDQYGFSITQLQKNGTPLAPDKTGKDNNFRSETVAPDGSLYVTKGSGGNGVNTVYHVNAPGGGLPTAANASATTITIAPGFSSTLAKTGLNPDGTQGITYHPFGMFFANATTLYVADEGDGTAKYSATTGAITSIGSANNASGGLEKWSLISNVWHLDYNLSTNLGLGQTYTIAPSGAGGTYPTGNNTQAGGSGHQWAPETDGLRNLTGVVNPDGTVTLYAVTSTVSGSGDQGTDPNQVVKITDNLANTDSTVASGEAFSVVEGAQTGTVYRGVAIVPEPASSAMLLIAGAGLLGARRRRTA